MTVPLLRVEMTGIPKRQRSTQLKTQVAARLVMLHVTSEGMLYGDTPFGHTQLVQVYEAHRESARRATALCPVLVVRHGETRARAA